MKKVLVVLLLLSGLGLIAVPAQAQQAGNSSNTPVQQTDNTVRVSTIDNRILVSNIPVKSTMEIYNIVGTKVKEIEMKQSSGEYAVPLPKGYYIVRIGDIVRKIVIR